LTDSRIKEKILQDAKAEAESILKEAKKKSAEIVEQSKKRVQEINAETQGIARDTKSKEIERRLSAARMRSRRAILQKKRTIIDTVFSEAKKRLLLLNKADYIQFIATLIKTEVAKGNATLILSRGDVKKHGESVGKEILKASGAKDSTPMEKGDFDGGCIVRMDTYEFNATLDTILYRIKEQLESKLQKILFS
jgi:V/A-type H+-transporting ATPase subunit E